MDSKVKVLEFRTVDEKPLFIIHMYDKETASDDQHKKGNNPSSGKTQSDKANQPKSIPSNGSDGEYMTQAQKRYLFRILAEQGKEADEAMEYLKECFQVDSLQDVHKMDASRMIKELLKEQEGGGMDDRPPF